MAASIKSCFVRLFFFVCMLFTGVHSKKDARKMSCFIIVFPFSFREKKDLTQWHLMQAIRKEKKIAIFYHDACRSSLITHLSIMGKKTYTISGCISFLYETPALR